MSEEMGLLETMFAVGWHGEKDLSLLSQFAARGRLGGPLEAFSDIPPASWPQLSWDHSRCDDTAITREGVRIYEVRLRVPAAAVASEDRPAHCEIELAAIALPSLGTTTLPPQVPRNPVSVLREIARMATPGDRPPTTADYSEKLASAGLSLTQKGRVTGVSMALDGTIKTAVSSAGVELARLLVPVKFEIDHDRYRHFRSRCDVARDIITWLLTLHPAIPGVDKFRDKLRNDDGRSLDALARELLRCFPARPLLSDQGNNQGNDQGNDFLGHFTGGLESYGLAIRAATKVVIVHEVEDDEPEAQC